jgi:hypothetical protein
MRSLIAHEWDPSRLKTVLKLDKPPAQKHPIYTDTPPRSHFKPRLNSNVSKTLGT